MIFVKLHSARDREDVWVNLSLVRSFWKNRSYVTKGVTEGSGTVIDYGGEEDGDVVVAETVDEVVKIIRLATKQSN